MNTHLQTYGKQLNKASAKNQYTLSQIKKWVKYKLNILKGPLRIHVIMIEILYNGQDLKNRTRKEGEVKNGNEWNEKKGLQNSRKKIGVDKNMEGNSKIELFSSLPPL